MVYTAWDRPPLERLPRVRLPRRDGVDVRPKQQRFAPSGASRTLTKGRRSLQSHLLQALDEGRLARRVRLEADLLALRSARLAMPGLPTTIVIPLPVNR